MPSLVEPSASDEESDSSEASWQDAAEDVEVEVDISQEGPPPRSSEPTIRLVRVRMSTDAAVVYDCDRRSHRLSTGSTIKVPFFDRTSLFLDPSPPLSPSQRLSPISTRHRATPEDHPGSDDGSDVSDLEVEYSFVDLPMPPEPLRSKHVYQPALSANFLSAPPSKLRRHFLREQRRRERTRSLPVRPSSLIGPYLHPPPARPHSSIDVTTTDGRVSPHDHSTYLDSDMRGPTTRLSPYDERMGRSLWSLSTRQGGATGAGERTARSSAETTDDSTTATSVPPTTWLGRWLYSLHCVPPAAWLFLLGFLFPPCW
jgi:hypothetical protein